MSRPPAATLAQALTGFAFVLVLLGLAGLFNHEKFVQPLLAAHDPDCSLPKEAVLRLLEKASGLGLTATRFPRRTGGRPEDATTTRIHFGGSLEQRERFVPDLVAGRRIGCTGSTEPDARSDPRGVRTLAWSMASTCT